MVQSWPPNGLDSNESLTQSLSLKPQDNKRSALFKRSHFKVPYSLMMGKLKISEVTINSFILRPEFDGQPCPKPCPCPSLLRCSCPWSQSSESNLFNLMMQCHWRSFSDQGIETKFCKSRCKFSAKFQYEFWNKWRLQAWTQVDVLLSLRHSRWFLGDLKIVNLFEDLLADRVLILDINW